MDDDDGTAATGDNTDTANYLQLFQSHLRHTADHLTASNSTFDPSYFPPCGCWTSEEKDAFFRALAVHSRLRPDLIAAETGKPLVAVCVYLGLLAEASARESRRWWGPALAAAVEVSDGWVAFEDEQAAKLAAREAGWDEMRREDERAGVLDEARRAMRRPKSERPTGVRDREEDKRREMALRAKRAELEPGWRREDYMRELCGVHLGAIDSIMREAEEPSEAAAPPDDLSPENSPAPPGPNDAIPDAVIDPELLAISGPPPSSLLDSVKQRDTPPAPTDSRPASPPPPNQQALSRFAADDYDGEDLAALTPRSRRRHQKRLYMRRKRAERTGSVVSASAARLKPGRKTNKKLERLLKKRKAEEDAAMGEDMEVDVDVGDALRSAKFTIGEEDEKAEYVDLYAGKEEYEVSLGEMAPAKALGSAQQGDEEEDEESAATTHANTGGTTLHYRIKRDLAELGFDAATLEAEGLGLFHLTTLGKLMNLHASLQGVSNDVGTCIAAPTLQLLHAHVVCFMTELLHRTIVLREQEDTLKARTKVWRLREKQVKASTVHQALDMMGAARDKRQHFGSLTSRMAALKETVAQTIRNRDTDDTKETSDKEMQEKAGKAKSMAHDEDEETADKADEEEGNVGVEGDDEDNGIYDGDTDDSLEFIGTRQPLPELPTHRQLKPPFIWHPSLSYLDPNPFKSSAAIINADAVGHRDGDILMPDETDEDALLDELREEDKLDAIDLRISKQAEKGLWEKVQRKDASQAGDGHKNAGSGGAQGSTESTQTRNRADKTTSRLKFAMPKPGGTIKSNVYVDDSD